MPLQQRQRNSTVGGATGARSRRRAGGVRRVPSGSARNSAGAVVPPSSGATHSSAGAARRNFIVAVLALLLGACVFAYPMVSNYLHQLGSNEAVQELTAAVDSTSEDNLEAARQAAVAYNERLLNSRTVVTDPFDSSAQRVTDEEYESVLNLANDGIMATITIPKIHLELPIYHGTSDEVLQRGVGHLQETSVPIGGESTHAVLSGHTGLPSMKVFDNLDQLEVGDYFIITVLGEDHAYRVTSTEVVLPDETESLVIQQGKDLVTLVTCTPYGVNTHRLLVHAERCDVPDEWLNKGDSTFPEGYADPPDKALLPSVLLGLALAAVVIGGYAAARKIREQRLAAGPRGEAASRGKTHRKGSAGALRTAGYGAHRAYGPRKQQGVQTGARAPRATGGIQPPRPYGPVHRSRSGKPRAGREGRHFRE